jgi:hypothetical protein
VQRTRDRQSLFLQAIALAGVVPLALVVPANAPYATMAEWKVSGSGTAVNLYDHFVLHISDGPIWWLKFHDDSEGHKLGIASQDKTIRILRMSKLEPLFSNPGALEKEAEEQSGLSVAQGPAGDPQIVPMQPSNFATK